jgi:hypothetical protein
VAGVGEEVIRRDSGHRDKGVCVTRKAYFWPILLIGVVLIVAPLLISLPSKADSGQAMLDNFHPIMQPASVAQTVAYFQDFQALRAVATGGIAATSEVPQLFAGLATSLHMSQSQVAQYFTAQYPAFAKLLEAFPLLTPVFKDVGPGLDHFAPLVSTMKDNVTNYSQVDSLPNFRLFVWFFEVPGVLLVIFSVLGLGLFSRRRQESPTSA